MALPIIIASAISGSGQGTIIETFDVTVGTLQNGKVAGGYGYGDGTIYDPGGSRTPTTVDSQTIKMCYADLGLNNFLFYLDGTHAETDLIRLIVEDAGGTDTLDVDGNNGHSQVGGYTIWSWNNGSFTIPTWSASEVSNVYTVTVYHRGFA